MEEVRQAERSQRENVRNELGPSSASTSQFVRSIAERTRRIRRDVEKVGTHLLHSNIAIGSTLARLASRFPRGSEKRIRYTSKATNAYDSVVQFSRRVPCTSEEAKQLKSELRILQDALEELGNGF